MMDDDAAPSFEEALEHLEHFLKSQGHRGELQWVFREDVVVSRRGWIAVRTPVPAGNAEVARQHYEAARRRGLGVKLEVLCRLGWFRSSLACFVWAPRDELDAEYALMPRGLKLSIARPLRRGKTVKDHTLSKLQQVLARRSLVSPRTDSLPRRDEAPCPGS